MKQFLILFLCIFSCLLFGCTKPRNVSEEEAIAIAIAAMNEHEHKNFSLAKEEDLSMDTITNLSCEKITDAGKPYYAITVYTDFVHEDHRIEAKVEIDSGKCYDILACK